MDGRRERGRKEGSFTLNFEMYTSRAARAPSAPARLVAVAVMMYDANDALEVMGGSARQSHEECQ